MNLLIEHCAKKLLQFRGPSLTVGEAARRGSVAGRRWVERPRIRISKRQHRMRHPRLGHYKQPGGGLLGRRGLLRRGGLLGRLRDLGGWPLGLGGSGLLGGRFLGRGFLGDHLA